MIYKNSIIFKKLVNFLFFFINNFCFFYKTRLITSFQVLKSSKNLFFQRPDFCHNYLNTEVNFHLWLFTSRFLITLRTWLNSLNLDNLIFLQVFNESMQWILILQNMKLRFLRIQSHFFEVILKPSEVRRSRETDNIHRSAASLSLYRSRRRSAWQFYQEQGQPKFLLFGQH